jgi:hypothetical protein
MLTAANATVSFDRTIIVFPTTQDATNYLNAMDLTAYSSGSGADTTVEAAYQDVTGHAPHTTKNYARIEGDFNDFSTVISHNIRQIDNIIITSDMHQVS